MFGIRLHWWIFMGIGVGIAVGVLMHKRYYRQIAREARIAVLGHQYTPEEEASQGRAIFKKQDELLRETMIGGAVDGMATLFMNLLRMIVLPLVFCSLVSGVTGLGDPKRLGRLGGRAVLWYLSTSLIAIVTGLILVNTIRPGEGKRGMPIPTGSEVTIQTPESVWAVLLNMVPSNIVRSAVDFDLFPIIFFALLFGIFTLMVPDSSRRPIVELFNGVFDVMLKMTLFILALAPIGIAALIARLVALSGPGIFVQMIGYIVTVATGLFIHIFITLPLIFWALTRRNPYQLMRAMSAALLTGFSTSSSSGTLPVTLERIEKGAGVSNKVSSFVLPLGATVNMDGTALYEVVATIFVAQLYAAVNPDFTLTLGAQVTIVILALMVSIGAAGIPSAGLVMMVIIFKAVGLPLDLVGILWAVDRVLDMCRTVANIWSDVVGATTIAHFEGEIDDSVMFHPVEPAQGLRPAQPVAVRG